MNRDILEQDPCNTCGYEEGSIYCKEHCPHEAKIEQETVFFPPCQDCNTKMDEIRRAYDKLQEPSGDAISRKIISAFLSGLISDETERKKALQYINELPSVNPRPCEDAISRENAIIRISWDFPTLEISKVKESLDKLPSVTPQPKTGHWEQYGNSWEDKFKCSECGKEQPKILCGERIIGHWSDYCPNCGARMIEPQESEEV